MSFYVLSTPEPSSVSAILSSVLVVILLALGFLVAVVAIILILRWYLHHRVRYQSFYNQVVLRLLMPKEGSDQNEAEEKQKTDLKQILALSEPLYANLSSLKRPSRWVRFWTGRDLYLSFEIVAEAGKIYFYVCCPRAWQRYIEQQIHAQYHQAYLEEVVDYNIFNQHSVAVSASLFLRRLDCFPIKTYKELEADPLNAVTNVLSKLDDNEGAAIQLIIHPISSGWANTSFKLASKMQQGKNIKQALAEVGDNPSILNFLGRLWHFFIAENKSADATSNQANQKVYQLTPLENEVIKGLEAKASKQAFACNLRIVATSPQAGKAEIDLMNIANAFTQYEAGERGNGLKVKKHKANSKPLKDFVYRAFTPHYSAILNTEELAGLWHPPHHRLETPHIQWLMAKKASAPINIPTEGIILGQNIYRGQTALIRMKREDRRRHFYVIGKSGSGKTVLLQNMTLQDIQNGEGVAVIDPHGEYVDYVLQHIPLNRVDDVIYFDPSDLERPMGLNMLEYRTEDQKDFAVQEMIAIFYKLFPPEMIGPVFEHNMRNVMLTLMADKSNTGTIADIPRMFTDRDYQNYKLQFVTDPVVRAFWEKEMAQTSDFHKSETLGYLISKVGRFVENQMMRNIIGQPRSGFDLREIMDNRKILLVNLSKGKTGEVNSSLLGLILVAKIQMAALSRADMPEEDRHDFYLYIDEFHNFITDSIATILSEARKYRLCLHMAHQYLNQLVMGGSDRKIRDAVLGNVGTMAAYRIGVEDAEVLAKEFAPVFNSYDLINVEKYTVNIKLLIDNTASRPFNMLPFPPRSGNLELAQSLKELSRLKYGRDRQVVEQELLKRTQLGTPATTAPILPNEASL